MSYKVVNTFHLPDVDFGERLLKSMGGHLVSGIWHTEDEIVCRACDADAVICDASRQPSFNSRVLKLLTKCRILASVGIGYSQAVRESASEFGIVLTNVPDYCLDEVSGRALAFILALGHRLFQLDKAVKEKQVCFVLDREALRSVAKPIFRMRDQTLGIIGLGKIGTATAVKARGIGMRVVAYDPYVFSGVMESWGVVPVDLDTLLKESDFVSIHTPLTAETHRMFGYDEFKKMKPTAYFINVARGDCVDEDGLIRALQDGLIAGAGLDVTAKDPISRGNPLIQMPNVILTGHSAMYSESADPELWFKPMTQVVAALRGEWPQYAVNPEVRKAWLEKWGKSEEAIVK